MASTVRIEGKRTVHAHTALRAVSWYANELAKSNSQARLNHIVTSMLFDAFTIEAYLNHLGSLSFSFWPPLKRRLSARDKLDVICDHLGLQPDFGSPPWQSMRFIFELRNLLAHAETEVVPFEGELDGEELILRKWPKAKWEEFLSVDRCQRYLDDTKAMIKVLATAAGISTDDVFAKDSMQASIIRGEDLEGIDSQSA